jgi:MFS family permease
MWNIINIQIKIILIRGKVMENFKALLRNRNVILMFLGKMVSNLGTMLYLTGIAWYIMDMAGEGKSGQMIAIFGICGVLPRIVTGIFSGIFVDRWDRRKIIYRSDLIQGVLFSVLAILAFSDKLSFPAIFIVVGISNMIMAFFSPAVDSSIPNIVEEKDLMRVNSIFGTVDQTTNIIGAAIAGILYYYVGIKVLLLINAISFFASGISEMFLDIPSRVMSETNQAPLKDLVDGFKYIAKMKSVMILMGFALILNFLFNPLFQIVFPKLVKFTLEMSSREYGLLQMMFPIGSILGMLILSMLREQKSYSKMITKGIVGQGLFAILISLSVFGWMRGYYGNIVVIVLIVVSIIGVGVMNALTNMPLFTIFQKKVDDEYRGRFFSLLSITCQGIVPLGLVVFGILSDKVAAEWIFMVTSIVFIIVGLSMLFMKSLDDL